MDRIRDQLHDHFDELLESQGVSAKKDEKGHYIKDAKVQVGDSYFVRELKKESPEVDTDIFRSKLGVMGLASSDFFWTEEVTHLNEEAVLEVAKTNPEILKALQASLKPSKVTTAITVRKVKEDD